MAKTLKNIAQLWNNFQINTTQLWNNIRTRHYREAFSRLAWETHAWPKSGQFIKLVDPLVIFTGRTSDRDFFVMSYLSGLEVRTLLTLQPIFLARAQFGGFWTWWIWLWTRELRSSASLCRHSSTPSGCWRRRDSPDLITLPHKHTHRYTT